ALTLPGTQKDVPPTAPLQHAFGDEIVFVLVAVLGQVGPVRIPLKVRLDLVGHIDQIGVDGQVVGAAVVPDGPDAFGLGLNGVHDANGVRHPNKGGLPIHAFQNSFD